MKRIALFLMLGVAGMLNAQQPIPLKGKELFGDLRARHIGPALMSGRVSDIEGHPTNNKVVYIGTAGGGVWKSADGGVMFNSIFDDYCQSIGCVTVDPNKPDNVIWVGTGEGNPRNSLNGGYGVYKSIDGGKSWKSMGLEATRHIHRILIDPTNPDIVYVGAIGSPWGEHKERGVYKTTDGGKTWNKIHNGLPEGKLGRMVIEVAPSNSNVLYATVECEKKEEKGMYKSEDAGATWKQVADGFNVTVRLFYFSRIDHIFDSATMEYPYQGILKSKMADGQRSQKRDEKWRKNL